MCPRLDCHPAVARALRELDAGTSAHCGRTGGLADMLGRALQLSSQALETLRLAAELHDVGKAEIPREILLKPAKLEPHELEVMRRHASIGHELLRQSGEAGLEEVATVVLHHHESMDGSGYPAGLKGEGIPVLSRVVAVVDAYDAIASRRPYHDAKSHRDVMGLLFQQEGGKYDPHVLKAFAKAVEHSPYRAD